MKRISILIKPASSLCNIRCKYCFYADVSSLREVKSYGKMTKETGEKMVPNLFKDLNDGDELHLAFQGGEPTLAGLNYFKHVIHCVKQQTKKVNVSYAIQTNGMIINEKWCQFLKENNFLVGLSIDGTPNFHDKNRLDAKQNGTFHRVLQTKKLFDQYEIAYNVLCVVTEELSYHAKEVFDFIQQQGISYIQFIPCLAELNATEPNSYALTPQGYARFYREMLSYWQKELAKGHYFSIKQFDDIINLLVRHQVTACGMLGNCQIQYVIEGDGSVFPCDFYALDEYYLGNICEIGLKEMFLSKVSKRFLCSRPTAALPKMCEQCPFYQMCRGGCKRLNEAMYVDQENQFCGYQTLLEEFVPRINEYLYLLEGCHL